MSDIRNQLIKDSFDYVLQSDLSTGIVYRIGGDVPVNPKFLSGLTINSGFTYSNGTEINGYVLTCDSNGNANWAPVSGASGTGLLYFVTSSTPTAVQSGDRWFNTNTGVELVWINDGDSGQWVQPFSVPGPISPDVGYYTTTGLTTSQTLTWEKTYWGISGSSNVDLTLPPNSTKDGYYLIIKDEAGTCGIYRIKVTPLSGLINGSTSIEMKINYMSLTFMSRNGNWYTI